MLAMLVCLQVSAWNGNAISAGDAPVDLVIGWPLLSAFCCLRTTHCSPLQTHASWQKGILLHWPISMEWSFDVPERRFT